MRELHYWTFKHKPGAKADESNSREYVINAVRGNYAFMQYEYGMQDKGKVTQNWCKVLSIKEGDVIFLRGDKCIYAFGHAIRPRLKADVILHAGTIIEERSHGKYNSYEYKGVIHFDDSEVFYENLDGEENWGQRVDVDAWQLYTPNGIFAQSQELYLPGENEFGILKELRPEVGEKIINELYERIGMKDFIKILLTNKNLILTGAPGTGKTYMAKRLARLLLIGKQDDNELNKEEFKIIDEQCGFVQFHPSYDYTDFVEGLRPINDKNGNVGFERRDGAFKSFCKDAIKITQSNALKMLERCKNNFPNQPLKSIRSNKEISFELKDGQIYAIASSGNKYPVNDDRIIRYLQTREYDPQHETYVPTVGKYILDNYLDDIEKPPYIFIIDEINRGEISKIFGELFFSIDPGYRGTAGRVKTQYQNLIEEDDVFYDGFYVPENVYIIGTMNDIDRSVESMDFAFRRRFAFKEVTAKESQQMLKSDSALSEKVDEIIGRMDALNEAICPKDNNNSDKKGIEGLSSAYHIGASYFLKLAKYKKDDGTFDYDKLWDYHLKGLLSEYLRGMPDAEEKLDTLRKAFDIKTSDSTQS